MTKSTKTAPTPELLDETHDRKNRTLTVFYRLDQIRLKVEVHYDGIYESHSYARVFVYALEKAIWLPLAYEPNENWWRRGVALAEIESGEVLRAPADTLIKRACRILG